jgi:acetyl-CoA synthetase
MITLRNLRVPDDITSWEDAQSFVVPAVEFYSIADDCLSHDPQDLAIIEVNADTAVELNFGELDQRSARLANYLITTGFSVGDRVGVKLSQSIDMAVAVLGVLRAGGVVVPLSNILAKSGLRHRLSDSQPRLLICAGTDAERELADSLNLPMLAAAGDDDGDGDSLASVTTSGSTEVPTVSPGLANEPALLLYTSGTTGKPKGVLQAQRFLLGHHALDLAFDRIRRVDVAYSPVDWTWAGGLMLGLLVPLAHGAAVMAHREAGFDPAKVFALMNRHGVSIGLFPPTVLRMMRLAEVLNAETVAKSRLRCLVTGAEAVEPELMEWAHEIGLIVNNAYGQTEANALIGHAACLGELDQRSMGRAYPGHQVAVLDDNLNPVEAGHAGQLALRADDIACMLEYWRNPEATADKIVDGWLLTGDIAHQVTTGELYFHGRSDDIIKSGSYRLGPAEIEAAVLVAAKVANCAVIGLPDEVRGETVTAVIELVDGGVGDADLESEIKRLVRTTVGAHAYPRNFRYVDRLPVTTTGKVDRATLRKSFMTNEECA